MSSIATLQKAIYDNLYTLRSLYDQAEGLRGVIDEVDNETLKEKLTQTYNDVVRTLEEHIDTTDSLIKALKEAL